MTLHSKAFLFTGGEKMYYCNKCGSQVNGSFCPVCGTPVSVNQSANTGNAASQGSYSYGNASAQGYNSYGSASAQGNNSYSNASAQGYNSYGNTSAQGNYSYGDASAQGNYSYGNASAQGNYSYGGASAQGNPYSNSSAQGSTSGNSDKKAANNARNFTGKVKEKKEQFDNFVEADSNVKIKVSDLFSGVFKRHTRQERDLILISGTSRTTPSEYEISAEWSKPWVFSRIFVVLTVTFLILLICTVLFGSYYSIPGMIFMGSLAVPVSCMFFFWEANVPRNISFFDVITTFFIGGALSLIVTLILYTFVDIGDLTFIGAILVAIIEETGKFAICAVFIKRYNTKYILNALLIGSAVGAGFAVFESAGYAFYYYILTGSLSSAVQVILLRAFLACGGHVVWAAITSAGFVLAKKDRDFSLSYIANIKFIALFLIAMGLHAVWDMPISSILVMIVLTLLAWVVIITLLRSGLSQINKMHQTPPAYAQNTYTQNSYSQNTYSQNK